MVMSFLIRHYTIPNNLVSAKYPNPTATDLDKHIILAVHGYSASTLSGKNLQTGQLRLLPIEFRRFYWMVTEETMSRLKLPHGKTGAPPLKENI
jgi:hypothetical protein